MKSLQQERLLLISQVFLVCFLLVAIFRGSFFSVNLAVNLWAASVNTDFFYPFARLISVAFDTTALVIFTLIVSAVLFIYHKRRYSLLLLVSMAGAAVLVDVCKILTANPRPLNELLFETNFSFPSGHVTTTTVLLGVLTYIAWKHWKTIKPRLVTASLYIAIVCLVGFDRVYLNVHWLSDVIGGFFLGAFWFVFVIYIFNRLLALDKMKPFFKERSGKKV